MAKKKIQYSEPDNYIPKDIWDKYFNEDGTPKEDVKESEEEKKKKESGTKKKK